MAKILVVDDDAETRVLLNALLGALGHDIVFAPDGESAIGRFERTDPDLVITDLVMPNLHGVELIEHLRAVYPGSRIIAISGLAPDQLQDAREAGAVAALPKPIDGDALLEAVDRALSKRRPWG